MIEAIHRSFWGHVRHVFLRGVVLIIPLGLTYWFFQALLNGIDGVFSPILTGLLGRHIPGLGFLTMLALIFLVGLLTRTWSGDWRSTPSKTCSGRFRSSARSTRPSRSW
jgi:uncharacterized membrane protein